MLTVQHASSMGEGQDRAKFRQHGADCRKAHKRVMCSGERSTLIRSLTLKT